MNTFEQHPIYTVDYFIKKFTAIQESVWIAFQLDDGNGRHCANGLCGVRHSHVDFQLTDESRELQKVFSILSTERINDNAMPKYSVVAAYINNGQHPDYQQPTPKQRILAALYDIKAKLQPEQNKEPKEVIRYKTVVIDSAVKALQEETLKVN